MIRLHLLGGLRIEGENAAGRRSVLSQPRRLALLAYLVLCTPRDAQRRDLLLGVFWPESDNAHGRGALRNALHFLRLALGPDVIHSRGSEEIELEPGAIWCDAVEFDRRHDAGDLEGALDLYGGDLLQGFFISDAPEFDHWLDGERDRLRRRAAAAARSLAGAAEAAGDAVSAERWYRRLLGLAPTDEAAVRGLMKALAAGDDRAEALRVYDAVYVRLEEEYGLSPATETVSLAEQLRTVPPPGEQAATPVASEPASSRQGRIPQTLRTPVLAAVLAAVLLPAAVVGFYARTGSVQPSEQLVAVLPFGFRGAPEHAWLSEGLADLLAANLNGAGELRTVDPRALLSPLQQQATLLDPVAARRAAAAHGAALFVLGSITETAGRLRITAALYDGAARDVVVEGGVDDVLALVDCLTVALLEARGAPTMLAQSAARTTYSVEALKLFLQGEAAWRRLDMGDALELYRRATELDSTFALAHYRLSSTARWQGISRVPALSAAAALRHAGRLAREDSLLVAAWYHHIAGSLAEANAYYHESLTLRPGHVEASFQLGELLFHWGAGLGIPASESREPFASVLAAEPHNLQAALHLARLAARDGRVHEVDSLVAVMRRIEPDGSWQVEMDALRAFLSSDTAWQRRTIEVAARQPNRDRTILEHMAAFSGNLATVERFATERVALPRSPQEQARMQLFVAQVHLARGRFRAAEQVVTTSIVLPPPRRLEYRAMMATLPFAPHSPMAMAELRAEIAAHPDLPLRAEGGPFADRGIEYPQLLWPGMFRPRRLYLLGALHALLGDGAAAMQVADSLAQLGAVELLAFEYERVVRARVHAGRSATADGLRTLGLPQPPPMRTFESLVTHGRPYERWLRGELLSSAGRGAEALRWYGTFPDPMVRDLAFLAPSHLRRAEILDGAGDGRQAVWHYRRFVELWADADAELQPEVERVRARLAALEIALSR